MKRILSTLALSCALLGILGAAPATAAPVWNLDIHHNETHFPPGGTAQIWIDLINVGNDPSAGTTTVTVKLPQGVTGKALDTFVSGWSCPGLLGAKTVTCNRTVPVQRHSVESSLVILVDIAPSVSGVVSASAQVKGGGAAQTAFALEPIRVSPNQAGFGIVEGSFRADFYGADGVTPVRASGTHPELFTTSFDFNSIAAPTPGRPHRKSAAESIRNLQVELPPGFIGNPNAVGECTPPDLTFSTCPRSSQVGRIDLRLFPLGGEESISLSVGVFNMVHPRGSVADLAFTFTGIPVHIRAALDPAHHYAIKSTVSDINESLPPFHQRLTLWGVPAAPSHDSERCLFGEELETDSFCPTEVQPRPFLTVPFDCESDNVMRLHHYDSWQHTGAFGPELTYLMPGNMTGCDKPRFKPEVEVEPTGQEANSPTGLDVHIKVEQNENPDAPATPPVKSMKVTLPEGMSFSPSFADGLKSCALAQMKLGTNEPIECPDASRIGEVTMTTPLLPEALEGSMYLAAQDDNPFGSLFALYLVLQDTEERGVLVKIPGKIEVDETTGQIVTIFDEAPQFPFDDLTLKFRSGSRAPLVSPPTCGTHTIGVEIASWARPQNPLDVSNTYVIDEGPGGSPCQNDPAARPFAPRLDAGTEIPRAGRYSSFGLQLTRTDAEQELVSLTTSLPPGLTAKLAGIQTCPDAVIASIATTAGSGASELADPACPEASQIGTLSAGLGAGPGPNYFPGKVYLAGPYNGAPLSLAIVAPGIAGPFDLGNVVVRVAVHVNPTTARVTAISDPFPTILQGVILRVRDVQLRIDRDQTTLNPTNCSRMAVKGRMGGLSGALFETSVPFAVGECALLPFKPRLSLRLFGGTRRSANPKLRATLRMPPGGANISGASVALPRSEFLAQSHIRTVCTRVQYRADACPAGSIYGRAVAETPLFSTPLEGPVYLRSSSNPIPDLVAKLKGPASQPVQVNLVGRIDTGDDGGIRTTFSTVPDAPVTSFTLDMLGGRRSLLENSTNLCRGRHRATAVFDGQNGATAVLRPKLQTSCKKKPKDSRRGRRK